MLRTPLVAGLLSTTLCGCAVVDTLNEYSAAVQADQEATRTEFTSLAADDKDRVQRCSAAATGRIEALRLRGQGGPYMFSTPNQIVRSCMDNPYYFASIPEPPPPPSKSVTCDSTVWGNSVSTTCR